MPKCQTQPTRIVTHMPAPHIRQAYTPNTHTQSVNISSLLSSQYASQRQDNMICLTAILESIVFLARQGLSIRGSDHLESNLLRLLQLRSLELQILRVWLECNITYSHWSTQNEFLELLANDICRRNVAKIKENRFSAVMADETADESRTEKLVVVMKHVNKELEVSQDVLGMYSMKECNAASIINAITDVILRCGVDVQNCRGQTYDEASVMMGSKSGIRVLFKELEKHAIVVNCQDQSLNLTVQDATSRVFLLNIFMSNVNDMLNFLRASP